MHDFKFYQACIGQKQLVQSRVGLNEVDGKLFLFQKGLYLSGVRRVWLFFQWWAKLYIFILF
jgi:hypothetical protein